MELYEVGYVHGIFNATDISVYKRFKGDKLKSYLVGYIEGYGYRNDLGGDPLPITKRQYEILSKSSDHQCKRKKTTKRPSKRKIGQQQI